MHHLAGGIVLEAQLHGVAYAHANERAGHRAEIGVLAGLVGAKDNDAGCVFANDGGLTTPSRLPPTPKKTSFPSARPVLRVKVIVGVPGSPPCISIAMGVIFEPSTVGAAATALTGTGALAALTCAAAARGADGETVT
jgi:hypothetical protein